MRFLQKGRGKAGGNAGWDGKKESFAEVHPAVGMKFQKKRVLKMLNPYGVTAAREYLLSGKELTRLEAMVLFAVPDLTKIISDLRREGYEVKRRTLPYAAALRRVNEAASLTPPPALPISDITLTEYWVRRLVGASAAASGCSWRCEAAANVPTAASRSAAPSTPITASRSAGAATRSSSMA